MRRKRLNLGVLDMRRIVRTEQCPVVTDSRGRRRIPAQWIDDPRFMRRASRGEGNLAK